MLKYLKFGLARSGYFPLGLLVGILQGGSAVALLATSAWLISRAAEQPPVMYLMIAVVGVRGFALGRAAFRYGERILLHDSSFRMLAMIRPRVFEKLIPFSPAGLGAVNRGQALARVVVDVDELQNLPLRVISPLTQAVGVSVLTVVGLAVLLPAAATILAVTLLAAFCLALPLSGWLGKSADNSKSRVNARLAEQSLEMLENHDVWLAYGWLSKHRDQINQTEKQLTRINRSSSISTGVGQALLSLLTTIATLGTAWVGAGAVATGQQPGVLLAVFTLLPLAVFDVVANAQPVVSAWHRFIASAKRVDELLEQPVPAIIDPASGELLVTEFKSLTFENVNLSYPTGPDVVRGISFTLREGETLVLRGSSGSGKSSVALAAARFLEPVGGGIYLNGNAISDYQLDSVRARIGYVEQDTAIFMGTLKDNLLIAKSTATDTELLEVLDKVGLSRTFELREGLQTQLGERGVLISGGEAQRVALARAILADFDVLILDEPTASVDQETAEELVVDLLQAAKQRSNRAVILITHDEQLSSFADQVVNL